MELIDKEIDKAAKRQKIFHKTSIDQIDKLIQQLTQAQVVLAKCPDTAALSSSLAKKLNDANNEIQSDVKEYYNSLGKLSKSIEKNLELAVSGDAFHDKEPLVNEAIALHFIREGHFDLASTFCTEANIVVPDEVRHCFTEMYNILSFLRTKNLKPALEWARRNRVKLEKRGSHLEFQLHQLQFLVLLVGAQTNTLDSPNVSDALTYARNEFGIFGDKYLKEIQRLMCCVLYSTPNPMQLFTKKPKGALLAPLQQSPYADLISADMWSDIELHFIREFCTLVGLAQESPLFVTVNVGAGAIPTMIKLRSVLDERIKGRPKAEVWTVNEDLPVEIPLSKQNRYHSVFACPVSRDQTTDMNPPMMLTCGHVISKESLIRLSKGPKGSAANNPISVSINTSSAPNSGGILAALDRPPPVDPMAGVNLTAKIKCPYCPNESLTGQSIPVSF